MQNKDIVKKINKERQTVKAYNDQKIPKEDFELIKETIQWAPSSQGFEPYRVLIFKKNTNHRQALKPIFYNQGVITEADQLLIFVSLNKAAYTAKEWVYKRSMRSAIEVKGLSREEAEKIVVKNVPLVQSHLNKIEEAWSAKQTYIALGMAMSAAAILNIGSTPIEGFDSNKLNQYLKNNHMIENYESASLALALGYPKSKSAYQHFGSGKRVRDSQKEKFANY